MQDATPVTLDDGSIVLQPRGELDMASGSLLRDVIETTIRAQPPGITLDLAHVTFLDSAGARFIRNGRDLAAAGGVQLDVANARPLSAMVLLACEGVRCCEKPIDVPRPAGGIRASLSW